MNTTVKGVGAFLAPLSSRGPGTFRKVLVVDDDPAMRRIVSKILSSAGYEVECATNGSEALEILQRDLPWFVITDWDMPVLDGAEFCRLARLGELQHYVYIIMLTGSSEHLVDGLCSGADGFVTKPIKTQELLAKMQAGARVLELEERLLLLASHDSLTGLLNRRTFFQILETEWGRSSRIGHPLSCAMIDVDLFKGINDTYGHLVGDAVLKSLSRLLKECCREHDCVGRYGGEEFSVLLPNTDEQAAALWAERYCQAVAQAPVVMDQQSIQVAVSVGVAQRHKNTICPERLLGLADRALLIAKESGRNQVVTFGSLLDSQRHASGTGKRDCRKAETMVPSPIVKGYMNKHNPQERRADVGKILIVDDDKTMRELLTTLLQREYHLATAGSGGEAVEVATRFAPDLVLLDIMMPDTDGYETCRRLKSGGSGRDVHVLVVSAKSSREEQIRAFQMGADDYVVKPIDPHAFRSRVRLHFRLKDALENVVSLRTSIESHTADIKQLTEKRTEDIIATQDIAVFTLAKVAESRDEITGGHLLRMRSYSQRLVERLSREGPYVGQVCQQFLDDLYRSSPLHDIGKVGISDTILLKPGPLTPNEFDLVKQHTVIGANILDGAVFRSPGGSFLAMAATIARFHHERFDGMGYPAGLVATEIPLPARIVAVADVFDALTSARPYKPAYTTETAKDIIEDESGRQFDPVVVEAFKASYEEFVRVRQRHSDAPQLTIGAMSFIEYDCTVYATT